MKFPKIICLLLSLVMLFSITAGINLSAYAETDEDYEYSDDLDCEHNYDNGKVTKKATCKATGVKTYTCTICGETKTETIAKTTSHTYKTTTTKATTKKSGSKVTKCSVCGKQKSKSTIYYPKTITLSTTSYTYNGKAKKPSVTVKNSKGNKISSSNYTVTYPKGRKNVGKYTVTIKFKGNYSGTVKKTFTIKPKATSVSKLTAKSNGFTVKWKKQKTQTTGYQIQYSVFSNFKNAKTVTVSKNSTTSKTVSKLSIKKKYYVRVRTYKTVKVNGKSTKIYSSWSKSKSVTTKKVSGTTLAKQVNAYIKSKGLKVKSSLKTSNADVWEGFVIGEFEVDNAKNTVDSWIIDQSKGYYKYTGAYCYSDGKYLYVCTSRKRTSKKDVTPKEVQQKVNDYIKSKGIPVNAKSIGISMKPSNSGWSMRIARGQDELNNGYTLNSCLWNVDEEIKEGAEYLYCYYDKDWFYILYL